MPNTMIDHLQDESERNEHGIDHLLHKHHPMHFPLELVATVLPPLCGIVHHLTK